MAIGRELIDFVNWGGEGCKATNWPDDVKVITGACRFVTLAELRHGLDDVLVSLRCGLHLWLKLGGEFPQKLDLQPPLQ